MERKFTFNGDAIHVRKNTDSIEIIIVESDTSDKYTTTIDLPTVFEQSKNIVKSLDNFYTILLVKLDDENIDTILIDKIGKIFTMVETNDLFELSFTFPLSCVPITTDEKLKEVVIDLRKRTTTVEKNLKSQLEILGEMSERYKETNEEITELKQQIEILIIKLDDLQC